MFYPASVLAAVLALALALPQDGVLVPARSLAGVRLDATEAQVRQAWGPHVGVCRGCPVRTLYFTFGKFDQTGAGAEFRRGRAIALFTLWLPRWRTARNVHIGDPPSRVTRIYGSLPRVECGHYHALVLRRNRTVTAFYFKSDVLWAFGLLRPSARVCR